MTIVSGSATRISSGHSSALISAITAATSSRGVEGQRFEPGSSQSSTPAPGLDRKHGDRSDRKPEQPAYAAQTSLSAALVLDRPIHLVATFSVMVDGAVGARGAGVPADRIVFLGHATVLIELDGVRVLTDPLLRARVAHLRRQVPPVPSSLFADIDVVLISHLHHDHLDLPSLRLLGRDTRWSCRAAPARGCGGEGSPSHRAERGRRREHRRRPDRRGAGSP